MYRIVTAGLVTLSFVGSTDALANEYVLSKVAKPLSQSIKLNLDPVKDNFSGSTAIQIEVLEATKQLQLNGLEYTASNIQLDAKSANNKDCQLDVIMQDTGVVLFNCPHTIEPGAYSFSMDFTAPYNRQSVGLYKTIDGGLPYLFTQFEMSDARRSFPSFDEPEYKIPFQVTITAPSTEKVYSNTPELSVATKDGLTTHVFAQTKPISSYLVAYAVGQFEEIEVTGMKVPGRVITTKGKIELAKYAAEQMPLVLKALEDYFGVDYPYQKLDSVAVPEFPFGAMENAGLVTYREDILLVDEQTASQNSKKTAVSIIAHELAHQWYGNLVTMQWWNDLWLNEAFASWMAAKVTEQIHPEFESNLALSKNYVMSLDARVSTKPIRKPIKTEADIMDGLGLAYSKGEAVLDMVENYIGEAEFNKGIRQYIKDHAFQNTEADDLWNALSKASGKDVGSILSTFIEQSSYPLIDVSLAGDKLTLKQSRFVNAGTVAAKQSWTVPVSVKYGKGDKVATETILLTSQSQTIKLAFSPDWIYPDSDAMGYYRWLLDETQMSSLLANAKTQLTARERKALISAADALLDAGFISGGELLNILGAFIDDQHPQIVSAALGYLQSQKRTFIDDTNQELWAKFIASRAQSAIEKYGVTAKVDEKSSISKLRPTLINLLAFEAKDKATIATAKKQADLYLNGNNDVDQYLIGTYLNIAVYFGDSKVLAKVKAEFEVTKDPQKRTRLMYALGYAPTEKLQNSVLAYSLTDKVNAPDLRYIFAGQAYTDERKQRFRDWIYANFSAIKAKLPPFAVAMIPSFTGSGCDLAALDTTNTFFKPKVAQTPEFGRTLAKLDESVKNCVSLKQRELASVEKYLNQL
ncbi:aminopeptidase [Shewanella sp. 10N.286.52.C2]|uniref:M1 family metallopeptidase n=1 Tax=Shewanella sp. 10N.286.52.C2 TaxID=1880838 RepID=UPI000C83D699|nr:M1 family metallopeptidase [Shewanella sp. 10N.286.52.C2]PMG27581.1 aminopeptidase [Shewanella sp. 10N.286.52.C2]